MLNVTETIKEQYPQAMSKSVLYEDGESKMREWMKGVCADIERPRIVEIGTYWGVSACILSDYGHVDTFDTTPDKRANKVASILGLEPGRVQRHGGRGEDIRKLVLGCVRDNGPFDIGHIDGDHKYEDVARDYALLVEAGCKQILLHDYGKLPEDGGRAQAGVNRFVEELEPLDPESVVNLEPFAAVDVAKLDAGPGEPQQEAEPESDEPPKEAEPEEVSTASDGDDGGE